jgi:glycosyltransferase involved in cell wall biosynthesis
MPNEPVTVIVLTYNHERYIQQAIESVQRQTVFGDCRVIVSDDCSTDRTMDIVGSFASSSNIRLRQNLKNLGTMPHYRQLIRDITTPYTALLEGDDIWLNCRRLELMLQMLGRYTSMGMCFSACIAEFESTGERRLLPAWNDGRHRFIGILDLMRDNPVATFSNCLYRTANLKAALDRPNGCVGYDWLCNMHIALDADIGFFPEPGTLYRVHSFGQWSTLNKAARIDMVRNSLESLLTQAPKDLREFIRASIDVLGNHREH